MKQVPSILLVDDDQIHATLVAEVLKSAGYAVAVVTDGFKALAACKVRTPDLIILGLYMPLMSGGDVLRRLQAEEKTRYIPVIFMKAKDDVLQLSQQFLDEHFVLNKPLEIPDTLSCIKVVLKEKEAIAELQKKEGQLRDLAMRDPWTSVHNLRFFQEFLRIEVNKSRRYAYPFSLVLVEPDQIKEIQKMYGTRAVDSIILQLAVVISQQNRKSDILARIGNTEFAMALTHTGQQKAAEVAERLNVTINQSTFVLGETIFKLTLSIGISQLVPGADNADILVLSQAREALSQARAAGGNRAVIAQ